jgi:long-chain acyl-CoA synthetase
MRLATFLAAHAARRPDQDAIVGDKRRLTFADLDERTSRAAAGLVGRGLRRGDRAAILAPNGVGFAEAFVATVKAGAIAVPINLRLSRDEISSILADCDPRVVFAGPGMADRLPAQPGTAHSLRFDLGEEDGEEGAPGESRFCDLLAGGSGELPDIRVGGDCVITYTSGTTGTPKGAILTEANYILVNGWLNGRMWRLSPDDRQLVTTPLAQRTGLARMMNMICHGCTLIAPAKFDATAAGATIARERVTFMGTVPTVARMLLPQINASPESFATLRALVTAGEAFPPALQARLRDALPGTELHTFYAMTEVGLIASMGPEELCENPAATGRLQLGLEAKIVDSGGSAVRPGQVGELWVRSGEPGQFLTMRGYFRRPGQSGGVGPDGWIATGDLCRMDADQYLYLVDRKKDMIVSGGFNVYSGEVELVIAELPGVRDVAVTGTPDELYGESVTAYIELEPGHELSAEQVVAHCRERIASYKKPRRVHFVSELPRSSSGKVLKRLLREAAD